MSRLIKTILGMTLLLSANFASADVKKLKMELTSLAVDRIPTLIKSTENNDEFIVLNILHANKLWKGTFKKSEVSSAKVLTRPITMGQFHLSLEFDFNNAIVLTTMDSSETQTIETKGLVLSSGPAESRNFLDTLGGQNLTTKAKTIEEFNDYTKALNISRYEINPQMVDLQKLLVVTFEETTHNYFNLQLRVAMMDTEKNEDPYKNGRYHVLFQNCITTGIKNLTLSLREDYYSQILENKTLKKDISQINTSTEEELNQEINTCAHASDELDALLSEKGNSPLDLKDASSNVQKCLDIVNTYNKKTSAKLNNLALPTRAQIFINLVSTRDAE